MSVKLKVVVATSVDGSFGNDTAKNISACMPTPFVTGESSQILAGFWLKVVAIKYFYCIILY